MSDPRASIGAALLTRTGQAALAFARVVSPDGEGMLPWADLWRACVASGAEIMVAEHDNPNDFDRFARVSAEAMRSFSKGAK